MKTKPLAFPFTMTAGMDRALQEETAPFMNNLLPQIPESAPFSAPQRLWLNGYLAGLLSLSSQRTETAAAATATAKPRVILMFASQSGNSESLAEDFAEKLAAAGFDAPVIGAEEHTDVDLTKEKTLLLISSTWGEGDPPDNAIEFWDLLSSDDHPRLENLNFAVLGLGDSNYLDFCGMGKNFDQRLGELGAKRIADRGDCDVDFEETAAAWFETVRQALPDPLETDASPAGIEKPSLKLEVPAYSKKNPFPAKLLANRRLNADGSERDTRHLEICLEGSGLDYEVGDVLGVHARNCPELVDDLISALPFQAGDPVPMSDGVQTTLREVLIEHYDLRTVNLPLLQAWAERSDSEPLHALLRSDPLDSAIEAYLCGREIIDLVNEHPARFANAAEFTSLLRKLSPRLYSIASSPRAHPGEVHLTVARVEYEAHGRIRKGVCSAYLSDRVNGDGTVRVFLQTAKHFKLPENPETPVIMVGPGTGIAPFRAFLEEREVSKAPGKNWLFFGNPHEETDFLYREELEAMTKSGTLQRLDTAWSRDQDMKIYVQDRMREAGAELWAWLEEGAHFYVCGDAKRMAKDVDGALHAAIAEHGGKSEPEAAEYVAAMKKSKRYQRDVY